MVKTKRVYEPRSPGDGKRIYVDRLWPRGLKKAEADFDVWLKDIAPSDRLRKWFNHDPVKWKDFEKRYWSELSRNGEAVGEILKYVNEGPVTFVFSAKDRERNNAIALKEFLERKRK